MKLSLKTIEDSEIVHHFDTKLSITSKHNTISVKRNLSSYTISLPRTLLDKVFGKSRLLRRLLRLDKCNVLSVDNGLVIIRQGDVYHWNNKNKILTKTIVLKNCRNILHNSMAKIPNGSIFLESMGPIRRGEKCLYIAVTIMGRVGLLFSNFHLIRLNMFMVVTMINMKIKFGQ